MTNDFINAYQALLIMVKQYHDYEYTGDAWESGLTLKIEQLTNDDLIRFQQLLDAAKLQ